MVFKDQPPAVLTNSSFLFDQLADGIVLLDAGDRIEFLNASACAWLGGRREDLVGQPAPAVFPPLFDLPSWLQSPLDGPREVTVNANPLQVLEMTLAPLPPGSGIDGARLITLHDITHHKQVEKNLRERESLYYNLFETNQDAIILTDLNTMTIFDCNQSACEMNGFTRDELIGHELNTVHGKETADLVNDPARINQIMDQLRREGVIRMEVVHRARDGREIMIDTCISLATLNGQELMLGIDRDITERKRAEAEIRRANEQLTAQLAEIQKLQEQLQAQLVRDSLTGLYNRRLLDETLQREMARSDRSGEPFSLLMVDTDHFKRLNDTYGHQAGDQVLAALGEFLVGQFRKMDIIFRFGGEEFLIVLPMARMEKACERAEALREALASLRVPYQDKALNVTASIGVASYPDHARTLDVLLQTVDRAMYQAKNTGRNRVCCAE